MDLQVRRWSYSHGADALHGAEAAVLLARERLPDETRGAVVSLRLRTHCNPTTRNGCRYLEQADVSKRKSFCHK